MPFGRLERTPASQPMSDINMTPLIDVMLVLLVIFMVTAPLMASRLRMDLPRTAGTTAGDDTEAVTLAITADGAWHLDDATVTPDALARALKTRAARQPDVDVLVRADRKVPYGDVARLLGLVRAAGLHRLAFVTEAEPGPDASNAHALPATPPRP